MMKTLVVKTLVVMMRVYRSLHEVLLSFLCLFPSLSLSLLLYHAHMPLFSYYRMSSLTIECVLAIEYVLLLLNVFSNYRMCSLIPSLSLSLLLYHTHMPLASLTHTHTHTRTLTHSAATG